MQHKKGVTLFVLFFMMTLIMSMTVTVSAAGKVKNADMAVSSGPVKTIAFLPILQIADERDNGISQILTNETLEFAAVKKATFFDDGKLIMILQKNNYPFADNGKAIDPALVKRIQQDTGADFVLAVRVKSLSQKSVDGNSSIDFSKANVQMEFTAASALEPVAWSRTVNKEEVIDYAFDGELGPERLAARELRAFLGNAWRKV